MLIRGHVSASLQLHQVHGSRGRVARGTHRSRSLWSTLHRKRHWWRTGPHWWWTAGWTFL